MKNHGTEFKEMLASDKRAEMRLLWGEVLILAALVGGLFCLYLARS